MGSGKTTTGKKLASLAGWHFFDLDSEIEKKEGKTIPEIFSHSGEEYFRKVEAIALRELNPAVNSVIATGGGAPCYHGNIDYMLSAGIVVYLELIPLQIMQRLETDNTERPLLKNIPEEKILNFIEQKLKEREKYYNQAHLKINGLNPDVDQLLSAILEFKK